MAVAPEEIIDLSKSVKMADVLKAAYCYAQKNFNKKFQVDDLYSLIFPDQQHSASEKEALKQQIQSRLISSQGLIQRGFISSDTQSQHINQKYYLNYGEKLIQSAYDHLDPEIYPYFQKLKAGEIEEIKNDFAAININTLKEITDKVVFMAMCSTRLENGYSPRVKTIDLIKNRIISEIKNIGGKIDGVLTKKYGLVGIGLCESSQGIKPILTDDRILIDEKIIIESMLAKIHRDLPTYYQQAVTVQNQPEKNTECTIMEINREIPLNQTMVPNIIDLSSIYVNPQSNKRKRENGDSLPSNQNMRNAKEVIEISDSGTESESQSETDTETPSL